MRRHGFPVHYLILLLVALPVRLRAQEPPDRAALEQLRDSLSGVSD